MCLDILGKDRPFQGTTHKNSFCKIQKSERGLTNRGLSPNFRPGKTGLNGAFPGFIGAFSGPIRTNSSAPSQPQEKSRNCAFRAEPPFAKPPLGFPRGSPTPKIPQIWFIGVGPDPPMSSDTRLQLQLRTSPGVAALRPGMCQSRNKSTVNVLTDITEDQRGEENIRSTPACYGISLILITSRLQSRTPRLSSIVTDIISKPVLPEYLPVTHQSRFQPSSLLFFLSQVPVRKPVMNYQLLRLEFISVTVR